MILKTCASNLLNLKCENIIGKLYLTMSSNKIIDFVPAADGKITNLPIDFVAPVDGNITNLPIDF